MPRPLLPFLRIPPFPGSRLREFRVEGSPSTADQPSDEQIDASLAMAAELRVGGSYWSAQPDLQQSPYTVVRVRAPEVRRAVLASLPLNERILVWTEGATGSAIHGPCDPWHLLKGASAAIVDSDDELALVAAIAGLPVRCIGEGPFRDLETGGRAAVRTAFRAYALQGGAYVDPFSGSPMAIADAIRLCGFWRGLIDSNRDFGAAIGFAFWKRPTVAPLLWNGSGEVPFVSRLPGGHTKPIAIWKSRTDARTLQELEKSGAPLVEVEDGFIRSVGLGADCVPPLSIVVDPIGIYFDPRRRSALEDMLREDRFTPEIVNRATRMRKLIVERGISKYGASETRLQRRDPARQHLLVPGQVEDDRSVICGGGDVSTNLELLRRVRANAPNAYIIYKPHPDVEAGHRRGRIPEALCRDLADEIIREAPISSVIDLVDEVHVNTSLAGFEALLRGKRVTTYGVPFYAGWGLTTDLTRVPDRRHVGRTVDELVAAALMLYPRYLDPVTGLPCPPEVVIHRMARGTGETIGLIVRLRKFHGRIKQLVSKIR